MQIVVEKTSGLAIAMFEDDVPVALSDTRLDTDVLMVTDVNATTHKVVHGPAPVLPLLWIPGTLAFNGTWAVARQELYDAYLPQAIAIAEADALLQSKRLDRTKASALIQIDTDVDAINNAVIGSRAQEYELAEKHAQEYKDAGYSGPVPSSVQSWATAKAWTTTQAADDILTTAAHWRTAQAAIRAQRLLRKEQVRSATDVAGITAATAAWAGFVAAIRGQLGA